MLFQGSSTEEESAEEKEKVEGGPEPLAQLITAFSRAATTEASSILEADFLYISYATIMGQVTISTSHNVGVISVELYEKTI